MAILGILIITFCWGCNQRITRSTIGNYDLHGGMVKNLDNDSLRAYVYLMNNHVTADSALILLGADTMKSATGESTYTKSYGAANALATGDHYLKINDKDLSDSILFTIPSNLQITSVALPDSRNNPHGAAVHIEWTAAANSIGYAYGVIKNHLAYNSTTKGFFQFVTTGGTLISIPPEAFRKLNALDTGWYKVYIYAYSGSFREVDNFPVENLPTAFPPGITDSISTLNLSGSFGVIVVSKPDSIHVTLE